jgi:hypothetical protein
MVYAARYVAGWFACEVVEFDVEHARSRPIERRQPQPLDASLRYEIGIENLP